MSDIGIFLLLFACLLLAVGVIRFFSWLTELQEKHGSLGQAGVNTIKKYVATQPRVMSRETRQTTHILDAEPEPLSSDAFSLLIDEEPQANGSGTSVELQLNAAEVAALQRMIGHNKTAAKPSKSSTIHAGFGVSRGGSPAYQRASLIYDALFGSPAPAVKYRERTPEQDALRNHLKLN